MKNKISELKNTVERIKSRLDEAEDGIRDQDACLVGSEMCIRDSKGQEEMKNTISELKNTVERIKIRL